MEIFPDPTPCGIEDYMSDRSRKREHPQGAIASGVQSVSTIADIVMTPSERLSWFDVTEAVACGRDPLQVELGQDAPPSVPRNGQPSQGLTALSPDPGDTGQIRLSGRR